MDKNNFLPEYERLNMEQRKAVDTIEGPVMVIAGPGTGKTQILTLRIANILNRTNAEPKNILALTFTEAGAVNMRKRLVSLIGSAGYYVSISTFHAFANKLIADFPEYFGSVAGRRSATDAELIKIIRQILNDTNLHHIKPFGDPYRNCMQIIGSIKDIKNEGFTPAEFGKILTKNRKDFEKNDEKYHVKGAHAGKMKTQFQAELKSIEKNEELAAVYESYEKSLAKQALYDYEDMLLLVIGALEKNELLLRELQETYQYILVDEHQDTNGAQNKILELLLSFFDNPNIFIVGDEKQAIYRFQGASLENFLYFKHRYPSAVIIELRKNYRSSQIILDSSQSLIEKNKAVIGKSLESAAEKDGEKIVIIQAKHRTDEYNWIAEQILQEKESGQKLEDVAVLYKENADVFPLARVLEKKGIPFIIESKEDLLGDEDIRKLIILLEAITDFGNEEKLINCLHLDFLNVDPVDVYVAIKSSHALRVPLIVLLRNKSRLSSLELQNPDTLLTAVLKLTEWKKKSKNESFLSLLERIIKETGIVSAYLASEGGLDKIQKLRSFFEEAKKAAIQHDNYTTEDFIEYLTLLKEHKISIQRKRIRVHGAVRLMTVHGSKGLEFDVVFIINAEDGHFGNKQRRQFIKLPIKTNLDITSLEKNEDERRLFYVALTRGRRKVYISYAQNDEEGKEKIRSQFLDEMSSKGISEIEAPEIRQGELGLSIEEKEKPLNNIETLRNYVQKTLEERGLSVTALNNYLKCPWRYFFDSLVMIPKAPTKSKAYGTAAHGALNDLFTERRKGGAAKIDYFLESFIRHLKREVLALRDYESVAEKGLKTLTAYYNQFEPKWNFNALTEYKVSGVELAGIVKLTGKLDKLELDQNGRDVVVVDYKVKQPESRNAIIGATADSTGNFHRQLVFYKLLLSEMPESKFFMTRGVIDFVEPNERGIFKKEEFEISDKEVSDLKELVLKVYDEIINLKFIKTKCDDLKCTYCGMRRLTSWG